MRQAVLDAGAAIIAVYGQEDFETVKKSDNSPLTKADLDADRIINERLGADCPDIARVTEESSETHSSQHERFFLVDPLDGTKEFIKRRGEFTVNIALIEHGVPVLGCVYAPALNRLFYTPTPSQAVEEIMSGDSAGYQGELTANSRSSQGLKVVASKSHSDAATDAYINTYEVSERVSAGSSLKFCLVASGEADLYPRLGRTMEWDTAAGDAVLRAAGGQVVDARSLEPLVYGKPLYENPHFIAFAPSAAPVTRP